MSAPARTARQRTPRKSNSRKAAPRGLAAVPASKSTARSETAERNQNASSRDADFSLDRWIEELPDKYVECRDMRHDYRPFTVDIDQRAGVYDETLRCARCKTKRTRMVSMRTGHIVRSTMDYAEAKGYIVKGIGRLDQDDRGQLRLAKIQHQIAGTGKR